MLLASFLRREIYMIYNFDRVIDRHHTYSTQWDYIQDRFGRSDILPFSISDTDFQTSNEILAALNERLQHPIFGYTRWNHQAYKESIKQWFEKDCQRQINTDWLVYSPSVVYTIGTVIRLLTERGDSVATLTPMYDAFFNTVKANHRQLAPVTIQGADQNYKIDWDTLEVILAQVRTKVFLLTNPHNPTGHLFDQEELVKLVELCQKYHVFIISDDIHRDTIIGDKKYVPITDITTENIILCCSNTKTFNTPGLIGAYAIIPDKNLKEQYLTSLKQQDALSSASILGVESTIASYIGSQIYVRELNQYLQENYQILSQFLESKLPELTFTIPDATYLAWINVSNLKITSIELQDKLINQGKVGIMPGATYGDSRYIRMNIGCPKSKLIEGLKRMEIALHS